MRERGLASAWHSDEPVVLRHLCTLVEWEWLIGGELGRIAEARGVRHYHCRDEGEGDREREGVGRV